MTKIPILICLTSSSLSRRVDAGDGHGFCALRRVSRGRPGAGHGGTTTGGATALHLAAAGGTTALHLAPAGGAANAVAATQLLLAIGASTVLSVSGLRGGELLPRAATAAEKPLQLLLKSPAVSPSS